MGDPATSERRHLGQRVTSALCTRQSALRNRDGIQRLDTRDELRGGVGWRDTKLES